MTSKHESGTPEQIEAEIERQREELAQTVDALHDRLDVKARAKDKAADLKDRATTDSGKPKPALVGGVAGAVAALGALFWWRRRR